MGAASIAFARALLLAVLPGTAAAAAGDDAAAWAVLRDANPFVAASGLPLAPPAVAPDAWRVDVVASVSNTELAFDRAGEHLVYDGEFHEARIAVTRAFGERWLVRASIGGVAFGDGFLDGFLDDYHRALGLDNGDRGRLGTDGHTIAYDDGAGDALVLDRRLHAVAPLLVDAVARTRSDGVEWQAGATLKLPLSHASPLVDDRATDVAGWLAAQSVSPDTRWPWGVRAGVLERGSTRLLPDRARDHVPFADALIAARVTRHLEAAAQVQWHGAFYDSAIPLLDDAATLTLSGAWKSDHGWTLRAGVVEDALPRHAQDVTLFVSFAR